MTASAFTQHAGKRLRQRGIPTEVIELLIDFGSTSRSHGAERVFFDKSARRRLQRQMPVGVRRFLERHKNIYVVLSDSGAIITAGHRTARFKRP